MHPKRSQGSCPVQLRCLQSSFLSDVIIVLQFCDGVQLHTCVLRFNAVCIYFLTHFLPFSLTHSEFQVYVLSVCVWLENQTQNLCELPNALPGTFIRRVTGICQYSWCKRQLNLHHFPCHLKKCLVCFRWTFNFLANMFHTHFMSKCFSISKENSQKKETGITNDSMFNMILIRYMEIMAVCYRSNSEKWPFCNLTEVH